MKKFYDGGIVTSTGPLIGSVSASNPLTLNKMALQNASLSKQDLDYGIVLKLILLLLQL